MSGDFVLSQSIKSWNLLITQFTLDGNDRLWGAVFFRNMIIQVILGMGGENGALGKKQGSS